MWRWSRLFDTLGEAPPLQSWGTAVFEPPRIDMGNPHGGAASGDSYTIQSSPCPHGSTFYEDWSFVMDEERASMLPTMAAGKRGH